MVAKQIYKNLYYDEDERVYMFADENGRHLIVEQQSYLLIYIIELLKGLGGKETWSLNAK